MKNNYLSLHTKGTFLASLFLILGLILTFLVCRNEHQDRQELRRTLLEAVSDRFEENIARTLGEAESLERSIVAFFSASESVDPDEWDRFTGQASNNLLIPGIRGLAVAALEVDEVVLRYSSSWGVSDLESLDRSLWERVPGLPAPARYLVMNDPFEPGGKLLIVCIPFSDGPVESNLVLLQLDLEVFFSGLWGNQGAGTSDCSLEISGASGPLFSSFVDRGDDWTSYEVIQSPGRQSWTIDIGAPSQFFAQLGEEQLGFHLLVGVLLSILAFALIRSLVLQNVDARERARELSSGVAVRSRVLEQTNKELRFFFEIVSRELKSPLSELRTMTGQVGARASHCLAGASLEHLGKMSVKVNVMDELLSDLLEYTSIDTAGVAIERTEPERLIAEILQLVAWPQDGVIVVDCRVGQFETMVAPLRQVLLNLIANAVRYRSEKPLEIRATVIKRGHFVEFEIADNGIGIDQSHQQSVFRMFHRLKQTQSEGTGVGLAIVDKVVSSAGGRVSLKSSLGAGSTFTFTWPLRMGDS